MAVYSHSRISCFENCPYKYKLKYIDKVSPEIEKTIEAFMGSLVHQALEKLYSDLRYKKVNTAEEIISYYNDQWEKNWNPAILIVRKDFSLLGISGNKRGGYNIDVLIAELRRVLGKPRQGPWEAVDHGQRRRKHGQEGTGADEGPAPRTQGRPV